MKLINIEDEPLLKTVSVGGLSAKALWRLIKSQRTIKAIPIEWIKAYIEKLYAQEDKEADIRYKSTWIAENRLPVVDMREIERIGKMIEEWEKENEKNID